MRPLSTPWRASDDHGQMMLLAGFVLVLAFILTALTLSQVADLEKQAVEDPGAKLIAEYRFVHDRLGITLGGATFPTTTNASFTNDTLASVLASLKTIQHEKGNDISIVLANWTSGAVTTEGTYGTPGPNYGGSLHSYDNKVTYTSYRYDGKNDGILWTKAGRCSTTLKGCISGALLRIYLSDGVSSVDETVVYGWAT